MLSPKRRKIQINPINTNKINNNNINNTNTNTIRNTKDNDTEDNVYNGSDIDNSSYVEEISAEKGDKRVLNTINPDIADSSTLEKRKNTHIHDMEREKYINALTLDELRTTYKMKQGYCMTSRDCLLLDKQVNVHGTIQPCMNDPEAGIIYKQYSDRQRRFLEGIASGKDIETAGELAGFTESYTFQAIKKVWCTKNIDTINKPKNIKYKHIWKEYWRIIQGQYEKSFLSKEYFLGKLQEIVDFDPLELVNSETQAFKDLKDIPKPIRQMIVEIKKTRLTTTYKLMDKNKALTDLTKLSEQFTHILSHITNNNTVNVSNNDNRQLIVSDMDDAELGRLLEFGKTVNNQDDVIQVEYNEL